MKAAICYEFGKPLVIEDVEIDPPEAGEVKVRVAACAICHSDIHAIEGAWGGKLPTVYGHEAAGIVEDVGPRVTLAKLGDHVVVSLIRSCGRCFFCAHGESYLCEADFSVRGGFFFGQRESNPLQGRPIHPPGSSHRRLRRACHRRSIASRANTQ